MTKTFKEPIAVGTANETNAGSSAHEKKQKLYAYLQDLGGAAVAFSAGVDSTFLLAAAREALGDSVIAVTGRAVSVPDRELAEAHEFCEKIGAEHVVVDVDQLAVPGFEENPPERCYLCKKVLFSAFVEAAALRGFETVIEGSNADDLNDYRPGMQALTRWASSSVVAAYSTPSSP